MNCKVCGKELEKEAKFCSNCGSRVAGNNEDEVTIENMGFLSDEETEQTHEVFHGYAQPEENFEEKLAATKNITFDWDLDDFNSTKDIENVDFNWGEVVEQDAIGKSSDSDSIFTEEDIHRGEPVNFDWALGTTTRIEKDKIENLENEGKYDIEELIPPKEVEEAIEETAEEAPKRSIDKFYTFNKKNEEFQALLDEEYERLRQRIKEENEAENVIRDKQEKLEKARDIWEKSDLEPVADDADRLEGIDEKDGPIEKAVQVPEEHYEQETDLSSEQESEAVLDSEESTPIQEEPKEESKDEPEEEVVDSDDVDADSCQDNKEEPEVEKTTVNHLDGSFAQIEAGLVAISQPIGTTIVDLCRGATIKEMAANPPKKRIKYKDIFECDDEDEEPIKPSKKQKVAKKKEKAPKEKSSSKKGKNIALNIVIVILLIIMVLSGILAFAPTSAPGMFIQGNIDKVKALFTKEEPAVAPEDQKTALEIIIEAESDKNKNIGKVEEGLDMGFSYTDDYGIEGLLDSSAFVDSVWHTDSNGETVNYGNAIVGTVISYFSSIVDNMNEGSKDILSLVDENSGLYETLDGQEKSEEPIAITLLKIGEIRTIDNKYYVMVRVTEKIGDGEAVEKSKVVQMVSSDKQMKITEVTDI